jgi:plasmid stabilization system protein ParE
VSQQVRLAPEASAELEDATRWYEERHAGLGLAFLAAVEVTVESLVRWPRAGAPIDGLPEDLDVRRVAVSRFPYYVAYLVTEDQIYVLAIAHDRRRPVYWSGRVDA